MTSYGRRVSSLAASLCRAFDRSIFLAYDLGTYLKSQAPEIIERAADSWLRTVIPFRRPCKSKTSERESIESFEMLQARPSTPNIVVRNTPIWQGVLLTEFVKEGVK